MANRSATTIETELRRRIGDGIWSAGARVATERDLADEFGAARNPLLADLCRAINEARNQPQWYSLKKRSVTPERRALYDRHHSTIVAAVRGRNAEQAAEAMREHLRCVNSNLFDAVV